MNIISDNLPENIANGSISLLSLVEIVYGIWKNTQTINTTIQPISNNIFGDFSSKDKSYFDIAVTIPPMVLFLSIGIIVVILILICKRKESYSIGIKLLIGFGLFILIGVFYALYVISYYYSYKNIYDKVLTEKVNNAIKTVENIEKAKIDIFTQVIQNSIKTYMTNLTNMNSTDYKLYNSVLDDVILYGHISSK